MFCHRLQRMKFLCKQFFLSLLLLSGLLLLLNPLYKQYVWQPYVLQSGLPLQRIAPSSGQFKPSPLWNSMDALKLATLVSWPQTQSWERRTHGGEGTGRLRYPRCGRLLAGHSVEQAYAKRFMLENVRSIRSDQDYIRDTRDCSTFVRERGYIVEASEREKAHPIAFSLLFYQDVEQLERLLRAVYRPHNLYCIHVDKKSPPSSWEAVRGVAHCLPNVFLASRWVSVEWGTISVLQPELICMQDLWNNKKWRYFINLTGQEFPLKTNLQLVDILTALNGSNDVDCTRSQQYNFRWYNDFPPPHGIQPLKGNVHITASRGFVDYILHNDIASDLLAWVKHTTVPDETYFATLNHNPHLRVPGAYLGPPDTDAVLKPYLSRYKNWGHNWRDQHGRRPFAWPCYGKRVRTICIFGVGDLPSLTSRKELFANKFHADFEPLTLDCMEEWLWNLTMDEYSGRVHFDLSFYQNLNVVKNHVVNDYG